MQKKKYNYQTKDRYIKYFSKLIVISVLKEIKSLSEDTILLKLSEEEAAKRLAIGTKTGKYHSQALKMRGITTQDYEKSRENFITILKSLKLNP